MNCGVGTGAIALLMMAIGMTSGCANEIKPSDVREFMIYYEDSLNPNNGMKPVAQAVYWLNENLPHPVGAYLGLGDITYRSKQ